MIDERFRAWLERHNYSEATIRATLTGAKLALAGSNPLHHNARVAVRRYLAFVDDKGVAMSSSVRERLLLASRKPGKKFGGHVGKRRRQKEAAAWGDAEWKLLADALVADESIEGHVLTVIAATSLRVGDLLRLEIETLRRGIREGVIVVTAKGDDEKLHPVDGAGGAWERLDSWIRKNRRPAPVNVAEAVCVKNPSPLGGDCAYQRVNRHLKELGQELGLEGRIHIHRMRRTVLVQALRLTRDIHAVSQLAGHRDIKTTARYLDEPMPTRVGELQKTLREKYWRKE